MGHPDLTWKLLSGRQPRNVEETLDWCQAATEWLNGYMAKHVLGRAEVDLKKGRGYAQELGRKAQELALSFGITKAGMIDRRSSMGSTPLTCGRSLAKIELLATWCHEQLVASDPLPTAKDAPPLTPETKPRKKRKTKWSDNLFRLHDEMKPQATDKEVVQEFKKTYANEWRIHRADYDSDLDVEESLIKAMENHRYKQRKSASSTVSRPDGQRD